MKEELLIWIAASVAILSFFLFIVNKILKLYGDDEIERYKNKR